MIKPITESKLFIALAHNAYSAVRSVLKHGFSRLCKFNVHNTTLLLYNLQQVIGTADICVC